MQVATRYASGNTVCDRNVQKDYTTTNKKIHSLLMHITSCSEWKPCVCVLITCAVNWEVRGVIRFLCAKDESPPSIHCKLIKHLQLKCDDYRDGATLGVAVQGGGEWKYKTVNELQNWMTQTYYEVIEKLDCERVWEKVPLRWF